MAEKIDVTDAISDRILQSEDKKHFNFETNNVGNQAEEILERLGIVDKISSLSKEQQGKFVDSFVSLWKIDKMGKYVEKKDAELSGGTNENGKLTNSSLQSVYEEKVTSHHEPFDWFEESVKSLADLVSQTDLNKLRHLKDSVQDPPARYCRDLDSISSNVLNCMGQNEPFYDNLSQYVFEERNSILDRMRTTGHALGEVVAAIRPISAGN